MDVFLAAYGLAVLHVAFAGIGIWLAVIDHHTHRLPDVIVLPTWLGSVTALSAIAAVTGDLPAWEQAIGVMAVVVLVLWLMAEAPGQPLGFGDVKLGGVIACHLGWYGPDTAVLGFVSAFVCGGIWALGSLVGRRVSLHDDLAFGPWLVAGYLCGIVHVSFGLFPGEII